MLLDATGELLGVPGIVTTFVGGTQNANPSDPKSWARDIAELLLRIHDVSPDADERRHIYDGNELGLYFLSGEYPERMAGHPLSDTIYDAIGELRGGLTSAIPAFFTWTSGPEISCGSTIESQRCWTGMRLRMATGRST